jgi:hypothetical protein
MKVEENFKTQDKSRKNPKFIIGVIDLYIHSGDKNHIPDILNGSFSLKEISDTILKYATRLTESK